MALEDHAYRELSAAGWFRTDADYAGEVGVAVLELMRVFAAQGHSGSSGRLVADIFGRLAQYEILTPLKHPRRTGEFHKVADGVYQSTRRHTLFSVDLKRWYDIDKKVPWWKRVFGVRRAYVSFPYNPQ